MKAILMNGFRIGDAGKLKRKVMDAEVLKVLLLFGVLVLGWPVLQRLILGMDVTAGYVDPGILVLVVLSLLCFLVLVFLSWWLVQRFWVLMGLPGFGVMVLRFKEMELWQQFGFYWLCYALLLLAGVGCLVAVI